MMQINNIARPTLLLDMHRCDKNIDRINAKVQDSGIIFRPHFKTHQSLFVGGFFNKKGIDKITVSSVEMAGYFASGGWNDITIAFPFNPREWDDINSIAIRSRLCLTLTGPDSARAINKLASFPLDVMIKIDSGYNRSGIKWDDKKEISDTVEIISGNSHLNLKGLLSHTGETYRAKTLSEINTIFEISVERVNFAKDLLQDESLLISMGDTPSASAASKYKGFDELRAGNFAFYDLMQYSLGVCDLDDIAVVLACPVVDIRRSSKSVVLYAGAVHLSKESVSLNGEQVFGKLVKISEDGWTNFKEDIFLNSLSQEHGIISDNNNILSDLKIGDLVGVIPVHSCLTSNLMGQYLLTDGRVADHMAGNNRLLE